MTRWLRRLDTPGLDVALVVATVGGSIGHTYWPPILWLVCALGAAFDRAWRNAR